MRIISGYGMTGALDYVKQSRRAIKRRNRRYRESNLHAGSENIEYGGARDM